MDCHICKKKQAIIEYKVAGQKFPLCERCLKELEIYRKVRAEQRKTEEKER